MFVLRVIMKSVSAATSLGIAVVIAALTSDDKGNAGISKDLLKNLPLKFTPTTAGVRMLLMPVPHMWFSLSLDECCECMSKCVHIVCGCAWV